MIIFYWRAFFSTSGCAHIATVMLKRALTFMPMVDINMLILLLREWLCALAVFIRVLSHAASSPPHGV